MNRRLSLGLLLVAILAFAGASYLVWLNDDQSIGSSEPPPPLTGQSRSESSRPAAKEIEPAEATEDEQETQPPQELAEESESEHLHDLPDWVRERIGAPDTKGDRIVRGRLVSAGGHQSIEGATISLVRFRWEQHQGYRSKRYLDLNAEPAFTTTSLADGSFELTGVTEGWCDLVVDHSIYRLPAEREIEIEEDLDLGDVELEAGGAIVGTVRTPDGELLEGGFVALVWMRAKSVEAAEAIDTVDMGEQRPVRQGQFEVGGLPAGEYRLVASDGVHSPSDDSEILSVRQAETTTVHLRLRPSGRRTGRILSASGIGVADAEVTLLGGHDYSGGWSSGSRERSLNVELRFSRSVRSDENGVFDTGPIPAGRYLVEASESGAGASQWIEVEAGSEASILLRLKELAITGRVLDPEGRPIPRAEVRSSFDNITGLGSSSTFLETWTCDEEGRFEVRCRADAAHILSVIHPGFAPLLRTDVAAGTEGLELELEPGAGVTGTVTDESGSPLAGIRVDWTHSALSGRLGDSLHFGSREDSVLSDLTGEDGRYELPGLAAGHSTLSASSEDHAEVKLPLDLSTGEKREIPIVLSTGATVKGAVETPDGDLLAGARVRLTRAGEADPSEHFFWYHDDAVVTDEDGKFEIRPVPAGEYTLWASPNPTERGASRETGCLTVTRLTDVVILAEEQKTLQVALQRGITLEGRLIGRDGAAIADALVRVVQNRMNFNRDTGTDRDGRFRVCGLTPGPCTITAMRNLDDESLMPAVVVHEEIEVPAGTTTHEVELQQPFAGSARIWGRVLSQGRPISDVLIRYSPSIEDWRLEDYHENELRSAMAITDSEGRYQIDGVAPGAAVLTVHSEGDYPTPFELSVPDEGLEQDLVLPTGGVRGTVLGEVEVDPHLGPPEEARAIHVLLTRPGSPPTSTGHQEVNERGEFAFQHVPPGVYRLVVQSGFGSATSVRDGIRVDEGAWTEVGPVEITPAIAYRVAIRNTAGEPVKGATISTDLSSSTFLGMGYSDENGVAELMLPAGTWTVEVEREGYRPARMENVVVQEGGLDTLEVTLQRE